jgi:hypothetical protein
MSLYPFNFLFFSYTKSIENRNYHIQNVRTGRKVEILPRFRVLYNRENRTLIRENPKWGKISTFLPLLLTCIRENTQVNNTNNL